MTSSGKISPWENSNLENEDIICSVDGIDVKKIIDIQKILEEKEENDEINLIILRNGKKISSTIKIAKGTNGKNSIGLYVKDKIIGVGTLTYIDPNSKTFGALGHSASNIKNELFNVSGQISSSTVEGIRKAIPGIPGEKRAILNDDILGKVVSNNDYGVFGIVQNDNLLNSKKVEVGKINEIELGRAEIITVTEENVKENYEIEIIELKNQVVSSVKGIKFKVTDDKLLEKTGGIIQGMSGSPIMQNGKIIGAVSHVIVDNPEFGYGVYLEWMLEND